MTDRGLVEQVRAAGEAMPHREWCVALQPKLRLSDGSPIEWQKDACTCDRDARWDARVAAALEAAAFPKGQAIPPWRGDTHGADAGHVVWDWRAAALSALRGEP